MKSRADLIKEATAQVRNDWKAYTIAQERKIYKLFEDAADYLSARIARYSIEGKVPPVRLKILIKEVEIQMKQLRSRLRGVVQRGQSNSIDYGVKAGIAGANVALPVGFKAGIGTSFIDKSGNIVKYDAKKEKFADSVWATLNLKATEALIKTTYGGITLSRRVWDVTWSIERQIRNQVNLAVLTGMDAGKLSRNIRGYLGIPRTFRGLAFREFHPGAGVYRSAYKNALRLSATELNRAFTEGVIRYGKEKDWVVGFIWHTGSGDPCEECLDYEDQFFSKDDIPFIPAHPFCLCWLEIVYSEDISI